MKEPLLDRASIFQARHHGVKMNRMVGKPRVGLTINDVMKSTDANVLLLKYAMLSTFMSQMCQLQNFFHGTFALQALATVYDFRDRDYT